MINHVKLESLVKENNQFQVERIEETVLYALENIDKVYYYFDSETADRMESTTYRLLKYYEKKPNVDEWDFQKTTNQFRYAPYHGEDVETLYKHADQALYDSKKKGKNQFSIYF